MAAPVRCGVLVISDRCYRKETLDESGPCIGELLRSSKQIQASVDVFSCVPDDVDAIQAVLKNWTDVLGTDLIITSGGTGFGVRDCTPEATTAILDRQAYGMMSAIAQETYPNSILSRGVAGTRKGSLIVNFPGSPKACKECFAIIEFKLPHVIDLLRNNISVIAKAHHEKTSVSTTAPSTGQSGEDGDRTTTLPGVAFRSRKSPFRAVPVPEAQAMVWEEVESLGEEFVNFQDALDRILGEDVLAKDPLPPFRASIKDGYAVLSADGHGERTVLGASHAGSDVGRGLVSGTCVRITTGAPVPDEADAVVQVEDTELSSHDANGEEVVVRILKSPKANQDIRPIGSDIPAGSVIAPAGAKIDTACMGVLATCGVVSVKVIRKPIIGLLSTGDELVLPDTNPLPHGKIRDSNKTVLLQTIRKAGFLVLDFGIAKDDLDALVNAFRNAVSRADVVVLTGGVSMGEKDLVKRIVVEIFKGVIHFGRVFMKPGLPTTFATMLVDGKKKLIFGLPGNPVSAAVTCNLFVLPALRKMAGFRNFLYTVVRAEISDQIKLDARPEFHRAVLQWNSGKNWPVVHSTGNQISSRLMSMSGADVLLCLPARNEEGQVMAAGEIVDTILLP